MTHVHPFARPSLAGLRLEDAWYAPAHARDPRPQQPAGLARLAQGQDAQGPRHLGGSGQIVRLHEPRRRHAELSAARLVILHVVNVDAKVHYPIPMHLQPAANFLGHKKGDFPVAEKLADTSISLPVHEFITEFQVHKMVDIVKEFFRK